MTAPAGAAATAAGFAAGTAAAPAAKPATVATAPAGAVVVIDVVKIYFDSGKADMPAGAAKSLEPAIAKAKASANAKVTISGYHDASGSLEQNQELAKQRALAVRDAIKAAGVADERFEMKKPELTQGTGGDAEARRVEVSVN